MKKLLTILALIPMKLFSQYITVPTHHDAQETVDHIIHGDLQFYCQDTVEWVVEKPNDRWVSSYVDKAVAHKRFYKLVESGTLRLSSKTNGGYTFLIAVDSRREPIKSIYFVKCIVNPYTQKINFIEIQKGDL